MKFVKYEQSNGIAKINFDDGKVNAMSMALMIELENAIDQAIADQAVIALMGRPDIFSAGFHLKDIAKSPEDAKRMVFTGAKLALKLLESPVPIVTLCTGHAYPMGAFLMMASDYRLGIDGAFGVGMNEVAIGMTIPQFAIELARYRLSPNYFNRTVLNAEMFSPEEAVRAGFIDQVVDADEAEEQLMKAAVRLRSLDRGAYQGTKLKARRLVVDAVKLAISDEFPYAA